MIRFFEWRGAPFPEDHTDETFNRVARKFDEGVDVKNIGGYCYEVARRICLEALKGPDTKRTPLEALNLQATAATATDEALETRAATVLSGNCLRGLPRESRELILEYYQDEDVAAVSIIAKRWQSVWGCGVTRWLTAHRGCATA